MKLTFLGTGGMVPTKDRNVMAMYLEYKGEGILIDCGEGTQRQMNIAGINRLRVQKILISHWHGDHVAGLVGLIQTLGNVDQPGTLKIYGPAGSKQYVHHTINSCSFDLRINLEVEEIETKDDEPQIIFENDEYKILAAPLEHNIPCLGYSFVQKDKRKIRMAQAKKLGLEEGPLLGKLQKGESVDLNGKVIEPKDVTFIKKGKKITFILDTQSCPAIHKLSQNATILVCEANYASALEEKAEKYKHMTAQVVAQIASQAQVERLILTHFSQRYKTVEEIEEDAKKVFSQTQCAYDFMKVRL